MSIIQCDAKPGKNASDPRAAEVAGRMTVAEAINIVCDVALGVEKVGRGIEKHTLLEAIEIVRDILEAA